MKAIRPSENPGEMDRNLPLRSGVIRWLKFNTVGAMGIAVQLTVVALLHSVMRLNYLVSTAIAVEATVVHNFLWHERFTWSDRIAGSRFERFVAFNCCNGAISLCGNVALMKIFAGMLDVPYFAANILSIACCSLLNFAVGDRLVFRESTPHQSM